MEDGNGEGRLVTLQAGRPVGGSLSGCVEVLAIGKEKGNQFQELDLNDGRRRKQFKTHENKESRDDYPVSERCQQNVGRWEVAVSVVTDIAHQRAKIPLISRSGEEDLQQEASQVPLQKPSQNPDSEGPRMTED